MDPALLSNKAVRSFSNRVLDTRHRPPYPADAVKALLSAVGVSGTHGARIVNVAAGTGKLTGLLAAKR